MPRAAVRVLHPGHDDDRPVAARPPPGSDRGGDPRGAVRSAVPVHRVREHRAVGPLGQRARGQRGRGGRARGRGRPAWGGTMSAAADPALDGAYGPVRRKEDARFLRGQGTFVDDIQRPGMLYGAILRSPLAHARIVSVDTAAALAHPRVRAVITGEMLEQRKLAWMPTLSRDVQAVLATDKVRFQGQEVAFVVAEDRYSARDALELIEVEYDILDPVVDARKALDTGMPVIRDDLEGKTDNHCFDWETGDEAATEAVFASAEVVVSQDIVYPRVHPAPMETCGAVADYERVAGKLTLWTTSQAPHAHRTDRK